MLICCCVNGNVVWPTRSHLRIILVKVVLELICHIISMILKLYCAYAGSYSEVKSEADSSDITEHPQIGRASCRERV